MCIYNIYIFLYIYIYIYMYVYIYIYRRANGIYIPKSCNLQHMDSLSLFYLRIRHSILSGFSNPGQHLIPCHICSPKYSKLGYWFAFPPSYKLFTAVSARAIRNLVHVNFHSCFFDNSGSPRIFRGKRKKFPSKIFLCLI